MFAEFKKPMFLWLQMNKFFMNKTIFKSSKDMTVCIWTSNSINPFRISRSQYQEHIKVLMEARAQEKVEKGKIYYELFNMISDHAKFDIQLCLGKPNVCHESKKIEMDTLSVYARLNFANLELDLLQDISSIITTKNIVKFIPTSLKYEQMIKDNTGHYKTLLRQQNVYLVNYADFCVGGLSETMLDCKISGTTAKDNIMTSPYIINIHETN
eukprot:3527636-Ditylum_brightwellii.AAC.1